MAGVNTDDLTPRERVQLKRLMDELYAPCPEQAVNLTTCLNEARPCAACAAAASLLEQRVRAGFVGDEARRAYEARFTAKPLAIDLAGSPAKGPENAPVTIVVWSDFECPHCRMTLPLIEKVFEEKAPLIRLVHKFYPLPSHPHADAAARAAVAAQNQGKYWEMEALLFANQLALEGTDLLRYAREIGLDIERFTADMEAPETIEHVARDKAAGQQAGLNGTPFIVVNGRVFDLSMFRVDDDLAGWIDLEASAK